MDYNALKFWLEVLILFGMVGNAVYTWASSRHRANKEEIETLRKDHATMLTNLDHRLMTQEAKVEALPGARDFHNALQEMTKMGGTIDVLNERLDGFEKTIERVERPLNLIVEANMKGAK